MKFAAYMAFFVDRILSDSFDSILYHFMYGCMFCMLLFFFLSPGATTHIGGCILQPSSGL